MLLNTKAGWNVRGFARISLIGSDAVKAVSNLITLLSIPTWDREIVRVLRYVGIGPAAKDALPALMKSLSDPNKDVRQFAALAIVSIER